MRAPLRAQHRVAHVARDRQPHLAQPLAQLVEVRAAGREMRAERLQRAAPAVAGGAAADRHEHLARAAVDRRRDQLAGAVTGGADRVALDRRHAPQPRRLRLLDDRDPAVLQQRRTRPRPRGRADRWPAPPGSGRGGRAPSPPSCPRRRRRAGSSSICSTPPATSPRPIASAASCAVSVPLNLSGATRTGRSRQRALERLARLGAVHREHDQLEAAAGVEMPAHLLHLDARRLVQREPADAGAERDQRERLRAQLVGLRERARGRAPDDLRGRRARRAPSSRRGSPTRRQRSRPRSRPPRPGRSAPSHRSRPGSSGRPRARSRRPRRRRGAGRCWRRSRSRPPRAS